MQLKYITHFSKQTLEEKNPCDVQPGHADSSSSRVQSEASPAGRDAELSPGEEETLVKAAATQARQFRFLFTQKNSSPSRRQY